jgi:chromosome segregation ATPase
MHLAALALAAFAIALPAAAQDDAKRLAQTREALRRAQESLQSTQAERDTLQQDKTKLEQQKQQADQALSAAATKQKEADAARARLSSSVASVTAERDRLKAELERERENGGALQKSLEDTRAKLADAEGRAADQRRTTLALRTMLERSVRSLSENEHQNQVLYDLGNRAVADYRECQEHGSSSPDGNLLGLGTVRTTSVAEELRREMDSVAGPATLARPASAPSP